MKIIPDVVYSAMTKKALLTVEEIGQLVCQTRKEQGVTQRELAMLSQTGTRFISDLENGKATCQIGKLLAVVQALGMDVHIYSPWERGE